METRLKFSSRFGFGITFVLSATLFAAVILGGTLSLARLTRQGLEAEFKLRGSSLARQFAAQLYEHLERDDSVMLSLLIDGILREEALRYVMLTDRQGKLLISNSRLSWRPMSMPDELRASVCQTADAVIRPRQIGHDELYNIAVRLVPFSAAMGNNSPEEALETACLGTLHLGLSRQQLMDRQRSAQFLAWGISLFTIASVITGYFLLRATLVKPLLTISTALRKMPEDTGRQVLENVTDYGEIGSLKAALLHVTQAQSQQMARLQRNCTQVQDHAKTLLEKNTEQAARLEQQGHSLHTLSELASKNMQSFNSLSESAQSAVEVAAETIKNTHDMEIAVGTTIAGIEDIRKQVTTNTERIVELGEKIAQINNVVKMINTIAAQTKLIAFNASIEAAGAGETGGRFSIVATEVRRLANTVVESVEEIKDSVSSIQTATSELILSSETGIRKVNQGVLQIAATRETLHRMSELLENNNVLLGELLESTRLQGNQQQLVVNGLKDISFQFEDALEGVSRTRELIRELDAMVEELA